MSELKLSVLIIDDDPVYRNLLRSVLKEKLTVFAADSPSAGFKILKTEQIDIVISDFKLPEMDGLKVLELIRDEYPRVEVIMISSSGTMDTVIGALRKGAADYLKKPFSAPEIWLAMERTKRFLELDSDLKQAKKNNSLLKAEVNKELNIPIVGGLGTITLIKQQMELVSQTPDTSVLIIGESGTGKELVARGIHNLSKRKDEHFAAVNMSAIPESLFESEFFGHKKGSFTGAISDKAGWFESANGGTLFFDEIGEMNLGLQVKLLRVLEDRRFTKIGTQREQQFDIRVISATNKTVDELTEGKNFRLDLFHRLGTFIIHLPPLRERRADIPLLTDYFLKLLSKKMGKNISSVNQQVYELFNTYSFPGNIRELRNLVERAVIVCQGNELLPTHFGSIAGTQAANSNFDQIQIFDLKELERQTIIKALKCVNYNKAEAARLLNIEWNALYRRIQKFDIKFPEGVVV